MKVRKITNEEAQKILAEAGSREKGQYDEIIANVKKTGQPVVIEDLTRGQSWGLYRKAKNSGIRCKVIKNGTAVVLFKE